jgi:hypothetical protein
MILALGTNIKKLLCFFAVNSGLATAALDPQPRWYFPAFSHFSPSLFVSFNNRHL